MKLSYYEMTPHESVSGEHQECFFIVCYPCGDTSAVAVAEAQDFDVPDYNLASRYYFHDETEANQYAANLARRNGLNFKGDGMLLD
jgi:hypothetical protein